MIALLLAPLVIALVVGYIAVGRWYAPVTAPRDAVKARQTYSYDDMVRRNFADRQAVSTWLWPVKMLHRIVDRDIDDLWESVDPERIKRREGEQSRRIADLERQLGIKRGAA